MKEDDKRAKAKSGKGKNLGKCEIETLFKARINS